MPPTEENVPLIEKPREGQVPDANDKEDDAQHGDADATNKHPTAAKNKKGKKPDTQKKPKNKATKPKRMFLISIMMYVTVAVCSFVVGCFCRRKFKKGKATTPDEESGMKLL